MRPKTFGRALGIGARFAGKALLAKKAEDTRSPQVAAAERAHAVQTAGERGRTLGTGAGRGARTLVHSTARSTQGVARGGRNFGRAVWNPFAHASSILWLEITGMFFALFVLFFAQHAYQLRGAWRGGEEHVHFLLSLGLLLLFLYFSLSSFVRARRKQNKQG